MDVEQYLLKLGDDVQQMQSELVQVNKVVNDLVAKGKITKDVAASFLSAFTMTPPVVSGGTNIHPAGNHGIEITFPTVFERLSGWYSMPEGQTRAYGDTVITMLVPAPLTPSNLDNAPCGLMKITNPGIEKAPNDAALFPGEHFQLIGLRCFWIDFGIRFPFFNDLMNNLTDDPKVNGTWRHAYTSKHDGWYYAPFTERQYGENSTTGLRPDETQIAPSGTEYFINCLNTKLKLRA